MSSGNGNGSIGIESLETIDTAWMTVTDPDNPAVPILGRDGEPWRVLVASPNGLIAIRAQRAFTRRAQAIKQRTGEEPTDEQFLDLTLRQISEWIVGWKPMTRNGGDFPYSPENAFYLAAETLVGEQVNRFFGRTSNFLASRSKDFTASPERSSSRSETLPAQGEAH